MILVDSSVWIDFFNGRDTAQVAVLDGALGRTPVLVGDLILTEVLQGFRRDGDVERALQAFEAFERVEIGGFDIAVQAAVNFRRLRAAGVTVRKTIDCLIATRCLAEGYPLLTSDRDFEPFSKHLGLSLL